MTARQFLESRNFSDEEVLDWDVAQEYLVDFTRMKVKEALLAASACYWGGIGQSTKDIYGNILASYPLENIK